MHSHTFSAPEKLKRSLAKQNTKNILFGKFLPPKSHSRSTLHNSRGHVGCDLTSPKRQKTFRRKIDKIAKRAWKHESAIPKKCYNFMSPLRVKYDVESSKNIPERWSSFLRKIAIESFSLFGTKNETRNTIFLESKTWRNLNTTLETEGTVFSFDRNVQVSKQNGAHGREWSISSWISFSF